jgi:SpoVK/Ycf46/Vps4 family AAA+-type ATPase
MMQTFLKSKKNIREKIENKKKYKKKLNPSRSILVSMPNIRLDRDIRITPAKSKLNKIIKLNYQTTQY